MRVLLKDKKKTVHALKHGQNIQKIHALAAILLCDADFFDCYLFSLQGVSKYKSPPVQSRDQNGHAANEHTYTELARLLEQLLGSLGLRISMHELYNELTQKQLMANFFKRYGGICTRGFPIFAQWGNIRAKTMYYGKEEPINSGTIADPDGANNLENVRRFTNRLPELITAIN